MGYAHQYANEILHRGRTYMEPVDFVPDWADKPRKQKYYPQALRTAMPSGRYPRSATLQDALAGPFRTDSGFDLDTLGAMLLDSYGLSGRRLAVQANTDLGALPLYLEANWSRGTASGGGLYPASVYWVAGPSGPYAPGVYHYSPGHHAMQQLMTGDATAAVRAGLGGLVAGSCDQFLVLGIKYWQNAFKYNSFSFHAVTMDIGTILATWQLWARPMGIELAPVLWFDEARLADVVGVVPEQEGIFAVVPLRWSTPAAEPGAAPAPELRPADPGRGNRVRHADSEKSHRVFTFEAVTRMQEATFSGSATRPSPAALREVSVETRRLHGQGKGIVPLPQARVLTADVRTALRRRRSSFGRFDAAIETEPDVLAAVLAAAAATRIDGEPSADSPTLVRLYVFVNHVGGIDPGAYRYDPGSGGLELVTPGSQGEFLQRNYFLSNYNLEQAAAVIVPTIRTEAVMDAVGDRGYRLVNATIGAISQVTYTVCAALEYGCGVVLGFDNISYIEQLDLAGTGESPLLVMMIGRERIDAGDYDYRLA